MRACVSVCVVCVCECVSVYTEQARTAVFIRKVTKRSQMKLKYTLLKFNSILKAQKTSIHNPLPSLASHRGTAVTTTTCHMPNH